MHHPSQLLGGARGLRLIRISSSHAPRAMCLCTTLPVSCFSLRRTRSVRGLLLIPSASRIKAFARNDRIPVSSSPREPPPLHSNSNLRSRERSVFRSSCLFLFLVGLFFTAGMFERGVCMGDGGEVGITVEVQGWNGCWRVCVYVYTIAIECPRAMYYLGSILAFTEEIGLDRA